MMGTLVSKLPGWARDPLLGVTAWKWPGLIVAICVSIALMIGVYAVQRRIAVRTRETRLWTYCLSVILPAVAILIPYGFSAFARSELALRGQPLYVVSFAAELVALIAGTVFVVGFCNRIAEIIIAAPSIHPRGLDAQLIRIVSRIVGLAAAVLLVLAGGQRLGIPLTTLLASAGVGGLAVALAAQDTLKSLFGTITLMADKPFRVGDRIIVGAYDGVVEDIGLRSTRLRLLTGHQATVSNDELARVDIENVGRRPHIRRVADIRIPLNTDVELVREAADIVRNALDGHEGLDQAYPPRVAFSEFNDDSFNIRFFYWYHPPDYWKFLEFSERLNLRICRKFAERGIRFSLPMRIAQTSLDGDEVRDEG